MNLKDFLEATLTQITQGIEGAQHQLSDSSGTINPKLTSPGTAEKQGNLIASGTKLVHFVEFDVAVTAGEEAGGKASAGIFVAGFGIGAGVQGHNSQSESTVSRVKFRIPITYPEMPT